MGGNTFWLPIETSLKVAITATIIVIFIGMITARFMANRSFKGKVLVETAFMLPLVLPPSVVGFGLLFVLGRNSVIGKWIEWMFHGPLVFTWEAAVTAAVVVSFPLMYQTVKTGFEMMDTNIEMAARLDGANEIKVFFHISLPLTFNSVVSGIILSFARALGEFGATLMFAGNIPGKTQTMPTAIYVAVDAENIDMAWKWVAMMIGISSILLFLVYRTKKDSEMM